MSLVYLLFFNSLLLCLSLEGTCHVGVREGHPSWSHWFPGMEVRLSGLVEPHQRKLHTAHKSSLNSAADTAFVLRE